MHIPMKKMLLISLLSVLGSAGAMAAEQSHFEHFITRDGAQLKDGDQVFRAPLFRAHARKDFRHQQADVMIHAHVRPDVSGTGHPAVVAGQGERDERRIQVDDRRQRIERPLGQRAFGTRAGR